MYHKKVYSVRMMGGTFVLWRRVLVLQREGVGQWDLMPYPGRPGGGLMSYSTLITLQVNLVQGPSLVRYDSLRAFPSRRIYFQGECKIQTVIKCTHLLS